MTIKKKIQLCLWQFPIIRISHFLVQLFRRKVNKVAIFNQFLFVWNSFFFTQASFSPHFRHSLPYTRRKSTDFRFWQSVWKLILEGNIVNWGIYPVSRWNSVCYFITFQPTLVDLCASIYFVLFNEFHRDNMKMFEMFAILQYFRIKIILSNQVQSNVKNSVSFSRPKYIN